MNKDTLAKIYDPLFTTKERGKGTGLGLTSVLYCIKNLHGKIEVQSNVGLGTTFRILLPLINKNVDSGEVQKNVNMSGKMIQVITQEKAVAEAIGIRFSSIGLTTQIHSDFMSAIEWLKINKESVGMIFLDYYMPLLKETDAMGDLQSIESQIPVMMISGKDNMSLHSVDFLSAEKNVINMPLNSDLFLDFVAPMMEKRHFKS
jgi:CheY-like chemotaxis protein